MGLLSQHLEQAAQRRITEYGNRLKAAKDEYESTINTPEDPGAVNAAFEKYMKALKISPQEDHQYHGGILGAFGHILKRAALGQQARESQQQADQAKQAAQALAGGAPGPVTPIGGMSPNVPKPNFTGMRPPQLLAPSLEQAAAQPASEISRGIAGAGEAVSGAAPGPAPVNAAAGAGLASPGTEAAAGAPGPAPIAPTVPQRQGMMSIPERTARAAGMKASELDRVKREGDIAMIGQRKRFMEENPDLFKDAQPFEKLQWLAHGNITRGASVGKGQVIQKPDGSFAQEVLDPYTGVKLGERSLGGVPLSAAREKISEMPFQDANGQWMVNVVDFDGKFIRTQPLGGTPQSVVTATAPQTAIGAQQHFMSITNPDGSTSLVPVTTTSERTTQRVIPGPGQTAPATTSGAPSVAPPTVTPPSEYAPRSTPTPTPQRPVASVGQPIPTGGVKAPLTANQRKETESGVKAVSRAMIAIERMRDNLDVLDNPLIAKAIEMQASTHTGSVGQLLTGRVIKGNKKAEQFAADLRAAMEDINVIRKQFGATAFRGKEGFAAMVSQIGGGQLLQNKEVLRNTLTKTLGDMKEGKAVAEKYLQGGNAYTGEKKGTPPTMAPPAIAPPGKVRMKNPQGQIGYVPSDRVKDALATPGWELAPTQ